MRERIRVNGEDEDIYHGTCAICREGIWGDDYVILDYGPRAHSRCADDDDRNLA